VKARAAILRASPAPAPYNLTEPLSVEEVELDAPGPNEVLIKIDVAGICHSDLSVIDGTRHRPLPMALGHEAAGHILVIGDDVSSVRQGDRVVTTFLPRCGSCAACLSTTPRPCLPGTQANTRGELLGGGRRITSRHGPVHHHLGVSAFATHAIVDERSLVRVDPDVPPDVAALLGCAVLTGGGALLNAARPENGETITVVGLGGIGMAAALVAIALGYTVYGVDRLGPKRSTAAALGLTRAFDPDEAREANHTSDIVIEAVGRATALETAIDLTAAGGRTVTVGLPSPTERAAISPLDLTTQSRSIIGSYLGSSHPARDIPRYVELWRSGRLPIERLVTHRNTLDQINDAVEELRTGTGIRHIITP